MGKSRRTIVVAVAALACASVVHLDIGAQQTIRTPAPLVIPSMEGGDLFRFYCASCHGREGKGDGPVAPALKQLPADLTIMARRDGGRFPTDRVERYVTGDREPTPAHGSEKMPVWGPIFQALDGREGYNRARIANIVTYLESIQVK